MFTGPSGTSVQNSTQSIGSVGNPAARLDIGYLDTVVQQLFSAGLADSTKNTYRAGSNRYIKLCSEVGLTAYPATERTLSLFVASMYKDGLAGSTAKTYLAGVRYSQIAMGMDDPDMGSMLRLEYAVKGFRKLSGGPVRSRLPITPTILGKLKMVWAQSADQMDATMLWAAACMCFFGFLRSGEIVVPSATTYNPAVHLSYGDVKADNIATPQYIEVTIKASKTDPFRKGVTVYLGSTGAALCPVAAILRYMVTRGSRPGPFFLFKDGHPLTRDRLVTEMRKAMSLAGVDSKHYSGHSFRIGAATTAAARGLQDSLIKTLGRWESAAYTLYIRTPRSELCAVASRLISN